MDSVLVIAKSWITAFLVIVIFTILYMAANYLLRRKTAGSTDRSLIRQITLLIIVFTGILILILSFPWPGDLRSQIGSLLGIIVSGVLAFSSATFIGNMLAGILLRVINNFKSGDFITVEDYFGRVSERGLFHTELQTVNRDLITLPNLFLATKPVEVTRSSGTFLTCEVSLGYDVSRIKIEKCLLEAAKKAGLQDAFVLIIGLGDFSVVYEIHGLLHDVKRIMTAKSQLNGAILDVLHEADIEIVSPNFMNQRQTGETIFIPAKEKIIEKETTTKAAEDVIFDKANEAENIENRKQRLLEVEDKIKSLQAEIKDCSDLDLKNKLTENLEKHKVIKEKMTANIANKLDELENKN